MNKCSYDNVKKIFMSQKGKNTMKKTYKIDVDCANCANKMEQAAKNTDGVKDATVNFMMLKMIVEFEEGQDPKAVMQDVLKNCKKVEDDCEIYL
mgnify:CR=1 FL=1